MKLKLRSHTYCSLLLIMLAFNLIQAERLTIFDEYGRVFISPYESTNSNDLLSIAYSGLLLPVIDPAGPFCQNNSNVFLSAIPPGGTWSGTGIVNSSTGEFSPSIAGPGSHIITYTDPSNAIATITIIVYPVPIISFISGDGTDCFGGSTGNTIITVTGGTQIPGPVGCHYLFDWDWDNSSNNDSYPSNCSGGIDLEDLNNIPAGLYYVTVTDLNGCTATGVAQVDQPEAITITVNNVALPCFDEANIQIDMTVSGGTPLFIYDWDWDGTGFNDDLGGLPSSTNDAEDPIIIGAGVYSVTVTDFLGCTAIATVTVTEPPELEASAVAEEVLCTGNSTGSITLTVTGGTPGYLFDWDYDGTGDNDDPQNPTNLPAGTYFVTVTDVNGCTATATVDVTEPLLAVTASATSTNVTCFGDNNGTINLTPGGGTGVYTYDWDNDGIGDNNDPQDLSNLPAGSYSVIVTDANGCTVTTTVTISEPPDITGTFTESICAGGSIVVNGTVYDESNPSGTEVFVAANGCDSTVTVTITFDPPLTGDETYEGCEGDGYSVVVGGTVYNESNPSGMQTVTTPDGCDSIVTISLVFLGPEYGEFNYDGCVGDGYSVVIGGTTYNESNPSGTAVIPSSSGCDSIITISLVFNTATYYTISNQGCQGDNFSVIVNGNVYNENNPSGTEVISNQAGCDSIITINLVFGSNSTGQISNSSCSGSGYSVVVNGTLYNESNPSGTEVMTNSVGCDSVITITLVFLPNSTGTESYTGCEGDGYSVMVNGTLYNENNPSGTEVLIGGNGCDSIVTITLTFEGPATGTLDYSGCTGDGYQVIVGGITFNENNPNGTVTITSSVGCDSIVTVSLLFLQPSTFNLDYEGCNGDGYAVVVNGTVYNQNNPSGTEIITNQAGCDSIILIDMIFDQVSTSLVTYEGCQNDGYQINVNGTIYNESNPQGTEVLTNSSGCDSTVTIDLTFNSPSTFLVTYNGCIGDGYAVVVNGTVYDESNQNGTEVLVAYNGCDSIVTIDLNFNDEIITLLDQTLCAGGFIVVNGNVYDENNPSGTENFVAMGGCDSVVIIDLDFLPPLTGLFSADICTGGYIVVNGTVYDENNPNGTEVFTSVLGCDSVVTVEIGFLPILEGMETYQGCFGDGYSVTINGTLYNEQNPNGTELLMNSAGCDSLVTIDLNFESGVSSNINYEGCSGDGYSVVVNNVLYDESNPQGEEHIPTSWGCDSVLYVNLVFHEEDSLLISHLGCIGDGYTVTVNGTVYNEQNPTGSETIINSFGCDSVVQIDLSFENEINVLVNPVVCTGGSILIDGNLYDESNPIDTLYYVATGGCDSIVYIGLLFSPVLQGTELYTGCHGDGYEVTVNGHIYNESNPSGTELLTNPNGCDSIVSVMLTYQICCVSDTISYTQSICEGNVIQFHGMDLDSSGTYTIIIPDAIGTDCDSVYQLQLTVSDNVTEQVVSDICEGDSYLFNGQSYDQSGVYSDTLIGGAVFGCDSIIQLFLNVHPLPIADAGPDRKITCSSITVTLNGSAQGGTIEWTGPGITLSNKNIPNPTVSKPGDYLLTVTSPLGCISNDNVEVTIDESTPAADAGPDLVMNCVIRTVQFQSTLIGQNLRIFWEGPGINNVNKDLPNPEVSIPGIYILHLTDTVSMCSAIPDTVVITDISNNIYASVTGPDHMTCVQQIIMLDGSGSSSGQNIVYVWMDTVGSVIAYGSTLVVFDPGMFLFMVKDTLTGCYDSTTVIVIDDGEYPNVQTGEDKILNCFTPTVNLDAIVGEPTFQLSYYWKGPQGGILSDSTQTTISVQKPGWYYFTARDTVNECISTDSVFVDDQSQIPSANAVVDNQINCNQPAAQIHSEHIGSGSTFLDIWYNSQGNFIDSSKIVFVNVPGHYFLEVHDRVNGCIGRDTVNITLTTAPKAAVEIIDEACSGDQQGSILVTDILGGTPPFTYTLNGNLTQTSSVFDHLRSGLYKIQVTDNLGCIWEQDVVIEDGLLLSIDIGHDIILHLGETYQLESVLNVPFAQIDSIIWDPREILSCYSCPDPIVTGAIASPISAIAYDEGCTDTAVINLTLIQEYEVYIPNVFSPNHDGFNDYFTIYGGNSLKRIQELQIFDRWGDQVLNTVDFPPNIPSKGWDGTFRDQLLNPGVYVYYAVLEFVDGSTRDYSGGVTLLR